VPADGVRAYHRRSIAAIEKLHLDMYAHYLRREVADYFRINQKIHQAIVDGPKIRSSRQTLQT